MAPQTMVDTIVSNIRELIDKSEESMNQWINFNADKKEGYLNPARHDVESLVLFLAYLTKSSSPANDIEMTQTSKEEHDEIVIEIRNALNTSVHVRTAWAAFCESMSQDLKPESKVTKVLKTFKSTHQEAFTAPPTEVDAIVGVVMRMINESEWCKSHWYDYADKKRMEVNPARNDVDSLVRYLADLTQSSPPANDNVTASSLKQAAKALRGVVTAVVNAR